MQDAQRKARLTEFLDRIWSGGEYDAIPDFIAPQYVIRNDPGDPWHGQTLDHAGFRHRIETSRAPFPDQAFTPVSILADGDEVAVSWHWKGTHLGDVSGFTASGKVIKMTGLTVYGFEGLRLNGHWQVCDRLGVFMQLQENAG